MPLNLLAVINHSNAAHWCMHALRLCMLQHGSPHVRCCGQDKCCHVAGLPWMEKACMQQSRPGRAAAEAVAPARKVVPAALGAAPVACVTNRHVVHNKNTTRTGLACTVCAATHMEAQTQSISARSGLRAHPASSRAPPAGSHRACPAPAAPRPRTRRPCYGSPRPRLPACGSTADLYGCKVNKHAADN